MTMQAPEEDSTTVQTAIGEDERVRSRFPHGASAQHLISCSA